MALIRIVSASQAKEYYYDKDPIFTPEGKGENSEWIGSLKDAFPWIATHVNADNFEALLFGLNPSNDKRTLVEEGVNKERRAGIDFAFSAPKSVSIMALHCGDDRIAEAHKDAVRKALNYVQDSFIYYRKKVDGKLVQVKSDNMIAAQFTHSTSRANDPQLHTHAVLINMTRTHDGKHKAISNEYIFRNQSLINNIYQNELAINLQGLGYAIDNYENKFEIKGVPEEAIEIFSKRSREIDAMVEKLRRKFPDMTEAQLTDKAVLISRDKKNPNISMEALRTNWEKEYSKENIKPVFGYIKEPIDKDMAADAINQIHKTEATFNQFHLLNSLIMQNRGEKSLKGFKEILNKSISEGQAVKIGEHNDIGIYSSPEMVKCECDIAAAAKNGKEKLNALLDKKNIIPYLPGSLTEGQKELITHILTSRDKINIIQGDAGTGKTYAVKMLQYILSKEKAETEIIGLGFTGKAARELADSADIKTSTIASFLMSEHKHPQKEPKDKIIIVDEASMMSSKDMLSLIRKAGNNRIVFIGDGKQLQAIGAGKMFKELQKENIIRTVKMEEVLRQTTDITKSVVRNIKEYQDGENDSGIEAAVSLLESSDKIREVTSKSKNDEVNILYVREKAVEEYLKSDDCLLLTPSRLEKDTLNKMAREKYLDKEKIVSSKKIKVRDSIYASGYLASEYKKGDVIVLKGKEETITKIDIDKNRIHISTVNKDNGKIEDVAIDPTKSDFAAYRESEKAFVAGDKIMFSKNNKKLEVQNGLTGVIREIDDNGNVSVIIKKDKEVVFNLKDYSYFDYGYAQTIHKAQGQTSKQTILVNSKSDRLSTEAFYVAATRAREEFKIITTDKEEFINAVKRSQNKSSTREFIKTTEPLVFASSNVPENQTIKSEEIKK